MQRRLAGIVERAQAARRRSRGCAELGRCARGDLVSSWAPIIMPAMTSGVRSQTRPRAGEPAAPQHRDLVGERHHLAELVGDHQHGEVAALRHVAQQAQHLVGLAGRQHRGRLVEDQKAALQVELLEDLELLLLAGGRSPTPARRAARGTACVAMKASSSLRLAAASRSPPAASAREPARGSRPRSWPGPR